MFHTYREKRELDKNLHWGDIRDVITDVNFCVDRLRQFSVARGQILGVSIDFCRRPYNTIALPCECVIDRLSDRLDRHLTGNSQWK